MPSKEILDYINLLEHIIDADAILVLAGAGMSAESGLPTYRDREGFWDDYPLYRELDKDYIAMASPLGFDSDVAFSWGFYAHQHQLYTQAIPHQGYYQLLKLLKQKRDYFVVTTNVDGLFLKAGYSSTHLHETHGTIHKLQCAIPCCREVWSADGLDIQVDRATMNAISPLPLCPHCGAVSRPNIFMFGDTQERYIWEEAQPSAERFREWRQKHHGAKVMMLEIGVGAEGLKMHTDRYHQEFPNSTLLRINPDFDGSYEQAGVYYSCMSAKVAICTLISPEPSFL